MATAIIVLYGRKGLITYGVLGLRGQIYGLDGLVLGGDYTVLASSAYFAVTGEFDTTSAAVYSVILLVPTVRLFAAQRYWLVGKVRTTVTGRPSGSVHLVGGGARWPILALALMVGAVIIATPIPPSPDGDLAGVRMLP